MSLYPVRVKTTLAEVMVGAVTARARAAVGGARERRSSWTLMVPVGFWGTATPPPPPPHPFKPTSIRKRTKNRDSFFMLPSSIGNNKFAVPAPLVAKRTSPPHYKVRA